jgi:hypothetical protein
MGIILFHIYNACSSEKKKKKSNVYAQQASICQKYIYAQACQVSHMVLFGSYPARRVFRKVDTRPTMVDT